MKKLNYILISFILLSVLTVISCGDEFKYDDDVPPTVNLVRFNIYDTILVHDTIFMEGIDPKKPKKIITDTVYYNGGKDQEPLDEFDILVMGHEIKMYTRFTDEGVGLSSVIVQIWGDTLLEKNELDTCYRLKTVPTMNIYGKNEVEDTVILNNRNRIPKIVYSQKRQENLQVREDIVREEYLFSVHCIDIAGNQDTTSYARERIRILSRETVEKMWRDKKRK